jgi:tRNA(fMet)-specific endonuclease VapC
MMGILVDSTFFIAAERRKMNAHQTLESLDTDFPDQPVAISVLTLLELAHGVQRSDNVERAQLRQVFLDHITSALDVYPVSPAVALRAGTLTGSLMRKGIQVATADLLIGVTALELGYSLLTKNLRHFTLIPGLDVIAH